MPDSGAARSRLVLALSADRASVSMQQRASN
jgi:hypothetical protein